jgi:hypothetical protein
MHAHTADMQVLAALFRGLVPDALQLVRRQLHETVPTCDHNLVASCFNLMDALMRPWLGQDGELAVQVWLAAACTWAMPTTC